MGATGSFSCSAEVNSACAKVFAKGENTCTAHKRRGPEGPFWDWFKTAFTQNKRRAGTQHLPGVYLSVTQHDVQNLIVGGFHTYPAHTADVADSLLHVLVDQTLTGLEGAVVQSHLHA